MGFLTFLRNERRMSERQLAEASGLSRSTLRAIERDYRHANPQHLEQIGQQLNLQVLLALVPLREANADYSTVAISMKVISDGFESWKLHFMDFVDEFRRSRDPRLIFLPPSQNLDERLRALLSSVVWTVCDEIGMEPPQWARSQHHLPRPWFVSGMQSLKATALVESPMPFRRNNIFVQDNFLMRA
jgi:transcriptional regulator with XRE-family HTH domain